MPKTTKKFEKAPATVDSSLTHDSHKKSKPTKKPKKTKHNLRPATPKSLGYLSLFLQAIVTLDKNKEPVSHEDIILQIEKEAEKQQLAISNCSNCFSDHFGRLKANWEGINSKFNAHDYRSKDSLEVILKALFPKRVIVIDKLDAFISKYIKQLKYGRTGGQVKRIENPEKAELDELFISVPNQGEINFFTTSRNLLAATSSSVQKAETPNQSITSSSSQGELTPVAPSSNGNKSAQTFQININSAYDKFCLFGKTNPQTRQIQQLFEQLNQQTQAPVKKAENSLKLKH